MVSGYKHFSHTHKLVMHDMPEGSQVSCSGCNSSAKKTIYICWQCNFFLHEQCFNATRSRKHPSHPEHSLTLVPYPTYPSNSFYCNSCKIVGTGFSYSCSDCEFDLHVQCAYSISDATNNHQPNPTTNPYPHNNSHSHQETMPPDMHNGQYSAPDPVQNQYLVTSTHPHNISHHHQEVVPPHLQGQYSSVVPNLASVSIPNQAPLSAPVPVHAQYTVANPYSHNNSYPNQELVPQHMHHGHNSSIRPPSPVPAQYSTSTTQDSYMTQNATQFSVPTGVQNPNTSARNTYISQPFTSVPPSAQNLSIPHNTYIVPPSTPNEHPSQDSYMTQQNATPYSVPTSAQNPNTNVQNMYTSVPPSAQYSSIPLNNTYVGQPSAPNEHLSQESYKTQNATSYPVPASTQNPKASSQSAYIPSVPPSPQSSSTPINNTYPVPPSAPNENLSHYDNSSQNKPKNVGIIHFSHPHGLVMVNLKRGKRQIACSGCQETLVGKGYACVEGNCGFQIDESCFNLEKEIQHKSHPAHKLALLSSSPYQNGTFTCNACFEDGSGFTYHCSICQHDLHAKCATLKETVKRDDHDHELKLFYECPLKGDDYTFYCDVCNRVVHRDHWTYYCKECDFGTHLDCVDREVCDEASDGEHVETLAEVMERNRIDAICRQNCLDNI